MYIQCIIITIKVTQSTAQNVNIPTSLRHALGTGSRWCNTSKVWTEKVPKQWH